MDKQEFLKFLEIGIEKHLGKLTNKEKNYTRDKGKKIIDLLIELETGNHLIGLDSDAVGSIRKDIDSMMFNYDHIRNMHLGFMKMIENHKGSSPKTEIILNDKNGNEYKITMNQIVTFFAWNYCSLCEIMRSFFMSVIDFSNLRGRNPTGLGSVIKTLKDNEIGVSFFNDIDTQVRNSFFHLTFRFDKDRIYCKNEPEKHKTNPWRKPEDNSQSDYIVLTDLIKLILNADRSNYVLMAGVEYFIKKSGY